MNPDTDDLAAIEDHEQAAAEAGLILLAVAAALIAAGVAIGVWVLW